MGRRWRARHRIDPTIQHARADQLALSPVRRGAEFPGPLLEVAVGHGEAAAQLPRLTVEQHAAAAVVHGDSVRMNQDAGGGALMHEHTNGLLRNRGALLLPSHAVVDNLAKLEWLPVCLGLPHCDASRAKRHYQTASAAHISLPLRF